MRSEVATAALILGLLAGWGAGASEMRGLLHPGFEQNVGQYGPEADGIAFVGRGPGYDLFLSPGRAAFTARTASGRQLRLEMWFRRAGSGSTMEGVGPLPVVTNYFLGRNSGRWRTNVPSFEKVRQPQLLPGVDLVWYWRGGDLEYDLVFETGAPTVPVEIELSGMSSLKLDEAGGLVAEGPGGRLRHRPPQAYRREVGGRRPVECRYEIVGPNRVRIRIEACAADAPLIVDPVLEFSTYLGGGTGDDEGVDIAVDASGNAYVAGETRAIDFPVSYPTQSQCGGTTCQDAFVAAIANDHLRYATFLGGSGGDLASAVAVDGVGEAWVAGGTWSGDFPVTPAALQPALGGGGDAFVARLGVSGALLYATYLGGSDGDAAWALAALSSGDAVVAGSTSSTDFPRQGAFHKSPSGAFLSRIDPAGGGLVFSTYLDSDNSSYRRYMGLAVDGHDDIYLADAWSHTADVIKVDPYGSGILRSFDVLGSPYGIAVDPAGNIVTGGTHDCGYRCYRAMVNRHDSRGLPIYELELLGYYTEAGGRDVAVDDQGFAYLVGEGFDPPQVCPPVAPTGSGQYHPTFLAKVSPSGQIAYSVSLGGRRGEEASGVAVTPAGVAWMTGSTWSPDFPTVNPIQPALAGGPYDSDAFVSRVASEPTSPPVANFYAWDDVTEPGRALRFDNYSECEVESSLWDFGDGSTSTEWGPEHAYAQAGLYTVSLTVQNAAGADTLTRVDYITVWEDIEADFAATPTDGLTPLPVAFTNLTTGTASGYEWDFGDGSTSTDVDPTHTYVQPGTYDVKLTAWGYWGSDDELKPGYVTVREVLPDFRGSPRIGRAPLTVRFDNLSQGNVASVEWSFGDGATSSEWAPTHTYGTNRRYTVSLTARGSSTTEKEKKVDYVLVSAYPPDTVVTGPGPDPAAAPRVRAFDALSQVVGATDFLAYGVPAFGVRVGGGDLDGDSVDEIVTGPGPGQGYGPEVRGFRATSAPLAKVNFFAYGTLQYGVIPIGLELDGDGFAEILTGPGPGEAFGPHVRGFDYDGQAVQPNPSVNLFAYGTLKYGVNVGRGQLEGDERDEPLTAPGPGVVFGPQVRGFRYGPPSSGIARLRFDAFASLWYGARIGSGDLDDDGWSEPTVGVGPGPAYGSRVRGFDYDGSTVSALAKLDFLAFPATHFGAEPRSGDLDGDGDGDLLVSPGPDPSAAARALGFDYRGRTVPIPSLDITAYGTRHGLHTTLLSFDP